MRIVSANTSMPRISFSLAHRIGSFECQAACCAYDAERRYVFVGLNNGFVHVRNQQSLNGVTLTSFDRFIVRLIDSRS